MKKLTLFSVILLAGVGLFWVSCGKDDPDSTHKVTCNGKTTTYNNYVKLLVEASCALGGCHDGSGTLGARDYRHIPGTTAIPVGLQSTLTDGTFEKNVLVENRMPRGGSLPDSILVRLECWFQDGYPQ